MIKNNLKYSIKKYLLLNIKLDGFLEIDGILDLKISIFIINFWGLRTQFTCILSRF